jgi:hypothetical protein
MATAFVDMIGVFLVVPLVPFLLNPFGTEGVSVFGRQLDVGMMGGLLASAFNGAQLVSAPLWGRFSDRYGRRPALMGRSPRRPPPTCCSLRRLDVLLFLSRLVQGAGGGTVGVIQATSPTVRRRRNGRGRWAGCRRHQPRRGARSGGWERERYGSAAAIRSCRTRRNSGHPGAGPDGGRHLPDQHRHGRAAPAGIEPAA